MTDGRLSKTLEDIQKRWDVFGEADALPRLLAAVDGVLTLAGEWEAKAQQITPDGASDAGIAMRMLVQDGFRKHAVALREVVTAALFGETAPAGEKAGNG